jgi:hypothetical protein
MRIGVTRQKRGVQVDLIVRRQGEDCHGVPHTGAVERFGTVRARCGDVYRADALNRAGKVGIAAPQHHDTMAL